MAYLWIKDGNQYKLSSNNIKFNDFLENIKSTIITSEINNINDLVTRTYNKEHLDNPIVDHSLKIQLSDKNKPIVYIPTHNIHDSYEWFRIFKDSHIDGNSQYTNNYDKFGFWIHAYFDKNASQNINTYFPNLYLVKAASSNTYIYSNNTRQSIDYINDFNIIYPQLFIDGIEVLDTEKVLLKNQFIETLTFNTINTTLSTNTTIYIPYTSGLENNYKINSTLRLLTNTSTYLSTTIINVSIIEPTSLTFILKINIEPISDISKIVSVADIYNGTYTKTSQETQNGVYQFINGKLIRLIEMNDKYKTYNQIIYVYQGLTQANDEYYLRRIEDYTNSNYSFYPDDSLVLPFIYSKGEAYLIKCEFDYNLDINSPLHPETAPFNVTGQENCYRMLLLDQDLGTKIMLKDGNGLGTYDNTVNTSIINMGPGYVANTSKDFSTLNLYTNTSINTSVKNVIHEWLNNSYFQGYPISGTATAENPSLSTESSITTQLTNIAFKHVVLSVGNQLSYNFTQNDTINIYNDTLTTHINNAYFAIPHLSNSLVAGNLINIQIILNKNGLTPNNIVLDQQFLVTKIYNVNTTNFEISIYPQLDPNLINEINSYSTISKAPNTISLKIDYVNNYGAVAVLYLQNPLLELELLEASINRTDLKYIYDISYNSDITNYCYVASTSNINLLSAPSTIDSVTGSTIPINSLLLIKNQTLTTENGIYVWNGVGNALIRYNGFLLLTNGYYIQYGTTNQYKTFRPSYTLALNQTLPTYGTTYINFIDYTLSVKNTLTINNIKQEFYKKWFYYGFHYTSNNLDSSVTSSGNFLNYYDNPININFNNVQINSVYGSQYTPDSFITNYLQLGINININQLNNGVITYNNTVNSINRLGFEYNKIYYGFNNKSYFLDNIKSHIWINIIPAVVSQTNDLFVYSNTWDENLQLGTIVVNHIFLNSQIPSTSESVSININKNLTSYIQPIHFNKTNINKGLRPDTGSYANALMQPIINVTSGLRSSKLIEDVSTIIYKENSQPKVSFSKRDKNSLFPNYYNVIAATTTNINVMLAPSTFDTYTPNIGDLILVKNQTTTTQNGIYYYNGSNIPLTLWNELKNNTYYVVLNGSTNLNKSYKSSFNPPLIYGTTTISFVLESYKLKKDNRLSLKPIEIAKLGVDNDTQPWQKISYKYDILESTENLVNIQYGINNRRRIRFIDGLTEFNILNNINNQGQYNWILNDDVIVDNAVVGCSQDTGPGTGTLIWYTGNWLSGTWINGIWISGNFYDGIWTNGIFNSYLIQDMYYSVIVDYTTNDNNLSIFYNGVWLNGTFNNGTWINGSWHNGIFNNGIWEKGTWLTGIFNNGVWIYGTWHDGIFNGGDFETGEWLTGTFNQLTPLNPSRFGTNAKYVAGDITKRAIWRSGTFNDGEVWSGSILLNGILIPNLNDQKATIFFSVNFNFGIWKSGTFVFGAFRDGIFEQGIWLGGYHFQLTANNTSTSKQITINPDEYYSILEVHNTNHNIQLCNELNYNITGYLTSANETTQIGASNQLFWYNLFYNMFENHIAGNYLPLNIDTNYAITATTINLVSNVVGDCLTPAPLFIVENSSTGDLDRTPFINSIFYNGTFKNGIWMNGWFNNGIFEQGYFRTGIINDGIIGIDTEV